MAEELETTTSQLMDVRIMPIRTTTHEIRSQEGEEMLFPVYTLKHREDFMDQKPFASFWLAAGESGFATKPDWQEWADMQIDSEQSPPLWLIDLSTTNDRDGLWKVLSPAIDAEEHAGFERVSIYEAVLGYLWLRYERDDIDLQTCLSLAGRHADAYDTSIECERFYSLLNRFEDTSTDKSAVQHEAKTLFGPFALRAQKQWTALQEAEKGSGLIDLS